MGGGWVAVGGVGGLERGRGGRKLPQNIHNPNVDLY